MSTVVYGPVPSRRLGWSLGVDLVPFKTCPYDCVYCQLGPTTNKTLERREYVPVGRILADVTRVLEASSVDGRRPDWIGLAGSGEPTLNAGLGELITALKQLTAIPVAVLTNGALLGDPGVRRELANADLVLPSLDAGDPAMFQYVNRPHAALDFASVVEGLIALRREFAKPIWLEVLLLGGVTSLPPDVERLAAQVRRVGADRVQLNTVVRPPSETFAFPVAEADLRRLCPLFGERSEVIAGSPAAAREGGTRAPEEQEIVQLLRRRPCTLSDVCQGLGLNPAAVLKVLTRLLAEGVVRERRVGAARFFQA